MANGINHFLFSKKFASGVSFVKFNIIIIDFIKQPEDKINIKEKI